MAAGPIRGYDVNDYAMPPNRCFAFLAAEHSFLPYSRCLAKPLCVQQRQIEHSFQKLGNSRSCAGCCCKQCLWLCCAWQHISSAVKHLCVPISKPPNSLHALPGTMLQLQTMPGTMLQLQATPGSILQLHAMPGTMLSWLKCRSCLAESDGQDGRKRQGTARR